MKMVKGIARVLIMISNLHRIGLLYQHDRCSREIVACGGLIPKEKQSTIKLNFCYIVPILEGN